MGIKFISDYVHDKLIKFARQKALRNEWNRQKFKENKDDVIIQARKTGFPIYKEQNFYEAILDGY